MLVIFIMGSIISKAQPLWVTSFWVAWVLRKCLVRQREPADEGKKSAAHFGAPSFCGAAVVAGFRQ